MLLHHALAKLLACFLKTVSEILSEITSSCYFQNSTLGDVEFSTLKIIQMKTNNFHPRIPKLITFQIQLYN